MIMMNDEVNDDDHYVSGVDDNDDDIDQSILLIRSRIDVLICFVTSQHVLYYCTHYSVSLTCTVHTQEIRRCPENETKFLFFFI